MPRKVGATDSGPSGMATTPEGRESELVSLAMDLVEKRMRNGTATSQEVTHFLKLGSSREKLEQQRIEYENQLSKVRMEAISSQQRTEEMYKDALAAMSTYQGREVVSAPDDLDD